MQEWYILRVVKGVLFREVSSVRSVLIEREVPLCFCRMRERLVRLWRVRGGVRETGEEGRGGRQ